MPYSPDVAKARLRAAWQAYKDARWAELDARREPANVAHTPHRRGPNHRLTSDPRQPETAIPYQPRDADPLARLRAQTEAKWRAWETLARLYPREHGELCDDPAEAHYCD